MDGDARSRVSGTQLWSSLLLCAREAHAFLCGLASLLGLQSIGPFAPLWLTRNGLVSQLLRAGLVPLQEVWEALNARLALPASRAVPATLAAFAPEILCLDETRLDAVGRYLKARRGLSTHDPACTDLKLIGLFDLRAERLAAAGMARGGARELQSGYARRISQGLAVGSLLLFDLGYFSGLFL